MINKTSILLGYDQLTESKQKSPGFVRQAFDNSSKTTISREQGHLMTVAPTGAGKGVSAVIPTLLSYEGTVVVVDPKGENYQVTAKHRKNLGQCVVLLDPFGVVDEPADSFNPLDVLDKGEHLLDDIKALSDQLMMGFTSTRDIYWDIAARQLLCAFMVHALSSIVPIDHCISRIAAIANMPANKLLKILSQLRSHRAPAIGGYLQAFSQPDRTFESILGVLRSHLDVFMSARISKATETTTFELDDFKSGQPMTIYLVIPPSKLESASGLLRLWVGSLLTLVTERKVLPHTDTLFIIDECAQLGAIPKVEQAVTLMRGYGCRIWTIWQDFEQLKRVYPNSWQTLINNCESLQMFGFANAGACETALSLTGFYSAEQLLAVPQHKQLLQLKGQMARLCHKVNYLTDPIFEGKFASNPVYANRHADIHPLEFQYSANF